LVAKTAETSWFIRPKPNPRARLRLFCLPYAGGGASVFRSWSNLLPQYFEVCAIQLPGRENRVREQPLRHISGLIQILTEIIKPYLNLPFAIFGHSMGAIVAFELARRIRKVYGLSVTHLFVASRRAPHIFSQEAIHRLPDASFIDELRMYDGIPEPLLKETELLQLLVPTIRADFAINETYVYSPEEPLACPISAFGGLHDPKVSSDYLAPWREHTCGPFSQHMLPGNHFFLQSSKDLLLQTIADDLTRALRRMGIATE
jgi:medium-chain acyl-[acyl-carrier-protein] hydrolase